MAVSSPAESEAEVLRTLADLDRALASVSEPAMRARRVQEALAERLPSDAYELVSAILTRHADGGTTFDLLRDALYQVLRTPPREEAWALPERLVLALQQAAERTGDSPLLRALQSVAPARIAADKACESALPRELADVPLGRRRSLARGRDKRLLEELARDSDATVIQNLLQNPQLCEADVVRMAALRPVAATTLVEIHATPRWSSRAAVRVALARNPYCPVQVAVHVVGGLPRAELCDMIDDSGLQPDVRDEARAELERRGGS